MNGVLPSNEGDGDVNMIPSTVEIFRDVTQ
jgi:hypothetical protein